MGAEVEDKIKAVLKHIRLVWAPKRSAILIKHSHGSDLLRKLFREGHCQVFDPYRHAWSMKAIILTVLHYRKGVKLSHQYLGHYAKLVDCLAVVTFLNNGAGLRSFKLQKPSIATVSFQNGTYSNESRKPLWSQEGISGPDVAFGFGLGHLRWFYDALEKQPSMYPTGSLRSNLVPIARMKPEKRPLLFVSTWRPGQQGAAYKLTAQVLPFLAHWCAMSKIDFVVLGSSNIESDQERRFFEKYADPGSFFSGRRRNKIGPKPTDRSIWPR